MQMKRCARDTLQARLGADWEGKRRRTSIVRGDETAVWALLSQLRHEYAPAFTPSSQASASPKKVPLPISMPVQRQGMTPKIQHDFPLCFLPGAYPSTPSASTRVVLRSPAAARRLPHPSHNTALSHEFHPSSQARIPKASAAAPIASPPPACQTPAHLPRNQCPRLLSPPQQVQTPRSSASFRVVTQLL